MAGIDIKSYNEILGDMVRKIISDTPVNDINRGSLLLTILEAAAANDFTNNAAILNVLELFNIDALKNADLDAYGSNLGLTRNTAAKASGFVTVSDSSITKRSTSLYPIKPAPISGTNVIHVNDASTWNPSGSLYLGRGTTNFEGPLAYSSIVNNVTFYTINLVSNLDNDHLLSESVIDAQGTTDRKVLAGTIVKIPANNVNPEVEYSILRDSVLPSGEDTSSAIPVVAIKTGSLGNAGINTIVLFNTAPFVGAEVTNINAFTNGRNTESDNDFRDRIKAYSSSLARGTRRAILSAIIGVSDETDGKQVASAVITEPADIGRPSIIYIDDSQGLQPDYSGQSVDLLVASASGNEEFFQLANYPLPRPQSVNVAESPYVFINGMELKVEIDSVEDSVIFSDSDFKNTSSATISEVVIAINDKATFFRCRLSDNSMQLLIYPVNEKAETIQVISDGSLLDANTVLKFPTNSFSYIALYQNNTRLKEIERSASIISNPFSTWSINSSGNIVISVDKTPDQDQIFTVSDFGGTNFNATTLSDWVNAFNIKFAGITASETSTSRLILTSNKKGSSSFIDIVGGSYLSQMFSGQTLSATGQDSNFALNRQNGNLQIKTSINPGDLIGAGSSDTKGAIISNIASGGTFNVDIDTNSRPSEVVIVVDAEHVLPRSVDLAVGSTILLSNQGSDIMRIMSNSTTPFKNIITNDYIYLTNRGNIAGTGLESWIDVASCGLFKVEQKGEHLTSGVDTYIDVANVNMVVGGPYSVNDSLDIQAFYSDKYPQIWHGADAINPAASDIQDVVDSINEKIEGVIASIFRTNYIKLTSSTEEGGSIAVPISIGSGGQLFLTAQGQQSGSQSHIANKVPTKDSFTIFERTEPTNTNVWLDRYTYSDQKGALTSNEEPNKTGLGIYSETLTDTVANFQNDVTYDDSISITSGQNKKHIRDIRLIIDPNNIGTRHGIPRSLLDYRSTDEYEIVKNLEISAEDNLVAIIDNDAVAKTIDMSFSRTGQINSGSAGVFIPTNLAFSANDADNEPGVNFGTLNVWGTLSTQRSTNFNDYAIWFRARNWYSANSAALILRAKEYGPIGDKIQFRIEYPSIPSNTNSFSYTNSPDATDSVYVFGSGAAIITNIASNDLITVTSLGGYNFRYTFPITVTVSSVSVGDVISIQLISGFSTANSGIFRVNAKNDINRTIDVYNPSGVATVVGNPTIHSVQCVADVADSLDGTYFVLNAPNGDTVKFWYDNNNSGTIEPNIGITTRSWEINVTTGDSAIQVATTTAAAILNDTAFSTATNGGGTLSLITITNTDNGVSAVGFDGIVPTSFTFAIITAGINDTYETLIQTAGLVIFPITDTSTSVIASKINESDILDATVHTSGTFIRATREESTVLVDELAYNHDPNPLNNLNEYVSLFDSKNWILTFQNSNPNFQLKQSLILSGVSPIYDMDTAPNSDASIGEYFKLVPVTLTNIRHHMVHRALSQLDIISDVSITNNNKKLQIKSDLLGSNGAIEIIGGRANKAKFKIIGDSQISASGGKNYLTVKIPAAPNTLSPGQHILLQNDNGVERFNAQISTDSMDVVKINDTISEYRYNNKATNLNQYVKFSIVDANGVEPLSYPTPGLVWRWTHNDSGSKVNLIDLLVGTPANQPALYNAIGTLGGATNLFLEIQDTGSVSTSLNFNIASSGQPVQADYITFRNAAGVTYAVWFDIDGANTPPTGATYLSATNKIEINILSTDSPNQIISKISSDLFIAGITTNFSLLTTAVASLADVRSGNLLNAFGTLAGWSNTNRTFESGDNIVGGYPIVKVNSSSKYIDVVNPDGVSMSSTLIGASSTVLISSTPIIEWRLSHASNIPMASVSISSNIATATTDRPHRLNVGNSFTDINVPSQISPDTGIVLSVLSANQFTYASTNANIVGVTPAGFLIKSSKTKTKYRIESLGYNGLFRLDVASGDSPKFKSNGIAIDDIVLMSGLTFNAINNGEFRILAVDDDSFIYQNSNAVEELDTLIPFNDYSLSVSWVSNSNQITGIAGSFYNLNIGDWVKKTTDDDVRYVQISGFDTTPNLATIVTLANNYTGITSTSVGHSLDQNTNINAGVILRDVRDLRFFEGDSVRVNDLLFITENINSNWFESSNSGTFTINTIGTNSTDGKVFLRVLNSIAISETGVSQGIADVKFSITESLNSKFSTIKKIHHIAIDESNSEKRIVYLSPGNRSYKWNQSNTTSVSSLGKIGYDENIVTGVDGYQYYTGILRKVQRIVDGFEPDSTSFPGRRAVGSLIEVLPPLPRRVTIAIDVTTQDGVNLSEISDEITSVIISYVSGLGVGEDVILSDIIVRVKNIDGVAAVTFITPEPSNERIPISSDEKAFIQSGDISIA